MELLGVVVSLLVFVVVMAWLYYLKRSLRDVPRRRTVADGAFIASSDCSGNSSADCGGGDGGGGAGDG